MHNARPWIGVCPEADPKCDQYSHESLDAQGWPRTFQYRDLPNRSYRWMETVFSTVGGTDENKVFVVTWEGSGELQLYGAEALTTDPTRHRLTFRFRPGNLFLRILSTDPNHKGDYVRNVHVFRQEFEPLLAAGEIFNPEMLDYLKPFGSVRFMDWMASNEGEPREAVWAERPRVDIFPWLRQPLDLAAPCDSENLMCRRLGGYPVEVLVALANKLRVDAHFNMPYRANDEWVRGFATYVRDHLDNGLLATVEYSNEVWNWSFPQAGFANVEGRHMWPDEGTAWLQFMGMRAAQVCRAWKDVFADQKGRVRCTIAPQTAWIDVASASLDCPKWVKQDPARNHPCAQGVDAIQITGYFGLDLHHKTNVPVLRGWLAKGADFAFERAFRYLEAGDVSGMFDPEGKPLKPGDADSAPAAIERFKRWSTIANARKMALVVGEGGTHFGGQDADLAQFLYRVANSERMAVLYRRVLDGFKQAGGTVWNAWGNLAPANAWSNGESLADRSNAKYRALCDFAAANPCTLPGCGRTSR
jgi:hypothetical protein